jgi:hypothetical protein
MFGVPFFSGTLHELLTTVLGILGSVEVRYGFFHFFRTYLVAYAVRANHDCSISSSVPGNHAHCWFWDDSTAFGHLISQRPRHCKSRLADLLAPNAHRSNLLACCSRLELVEHSSRGNYASSLFFIIRLMVYRKHLHLEHFFFLIPKNENGWVTTVCNNKVVFLDQQDSSCAPT